MGAMDTGHLQPLHGRIAPLYRQTNCDTDKCKDKELNEALEANMHV